MNKIIIENLKKISKDVKTNIKEERINPLARSYIELDELSKKVTAELNKIKKYLSKQSRVREEFPDLGKYLTSVEGRARSYISVPELSDDYGKDAVLDISSVSEKSLREFLTGHYPSKTEDEINELVNKYKKPDGRGEPSIRIYKLEG